MNRILFFLICMMAYFSLAADYYVESYNLASKNVVNQKEDVKIIRNINGGTVIMPEFDNSCPEDIKAPFTHACKILEEYLPPSLPLRVKISVDSLTGQNANSISRVKSRIIEQFAGFDNASIHFSRIKGVILAEMANNSNVTFAPYVPDTSFLTENPDIEITYNETFLEEMSFSLEPNPGNSYDFISLVLRDLLKGLGLNCGFRSVSQTKGLEKPNRPLTFFENQIDLTLGVNLSNIEKLANATKGVLTVPKGYKTTLQLYAPTSWKNGISLNYFSPQDDSDVSNILTPDFCKGMVYRSLSDNYDDLIFTTLLGWAPDAPSGSSKEYTIEGSTAVLMPYNGSAALNSNTISLGMAAEGISSDNDLQYSSTPSVKHPSDELSGYTPGDNDELSRYLDSFHPFFLGDSDYSNAFVAISVLKKDGTWDTVKVSTYSSPQYNMQDWTFHCNESEYARTIDGYLRGRISHRYRDSYYGYTYYKSLFFVIDYVPQKVSLKYKPLYDDTAATTANNSVMSSTQKVRIYFSDTEGAEQIILERLKFGSRIPNKIPVSDFKKGYYDTTVDQTTTFTAVAYNKNGSSRGLSIIVSPMNVHSITKPFSVNVTDQSIEIKSDIAPSSYSYEIRPLTLTSHSTIINGTTDKTIDISDLSNGDYVLTVVETISNASNITKFRK